MELLDALRWFAGGAFVFAGIPKITLGPAALAARGYAVVASLGRARAAAIGAFEVAAGLTLVAAGPLGLPAVSQGAALLLAVLMVGAAWAQLKGPTPGKAFLPIVLLAMLLPLVGGGAPSATGIL